MVRMPKLSGAMKSFFSIVSDADHVLKWNCQTLLHQAKRRFIGLTKRHAIQLVRNDDLIHHRAQSQCTQLGALNFRTIKDCPHLLGKHLFPK